jgi:hypothetical protein
MAQENEIEQNFTFFQFKKENDYPIYIKCQVQHFGPELLSFLKNMGFEKLSDTEREEVEQNMDVIPDCRVLLLTEASPLVARQIDQPQETDQYGKESLIPKEGYKIYRYKSHAMVIYSYVSIEWQMACFSDFGVEEDQNQAYRTIINRYLSWSLAPMGIVGFWGVPVKEGIVVMKQEDSIGEAVFFDMNNGLLLSMDGIKKVSPRFKILRLENNLRVKNKRMSKEELMGFLSHHTTFMDNRGMTVPVRQMVQVLAQTVEGMIHPKESFNPKSGPSVAT